MKIAIVNGSTRKDGSTAEILRKIYNILMEKNDVKVSYYDLIDYEIKYCTGCRECYRTGKCCISTDNIENLSKEIKNADGIIMGSSTFGSYVTSRLKSFWDRGHYIVEQSLYGKYGFSVANYEIADGYKTINAVKKFYLVAGAIRSGSLIKKINFNEDPLSLRKFVTKVEQRTERFYRAVKSKKKRSFFEYVFTKIILIPIIWRPKFEKKEDEYRGILDSWRDKGIIR